MPKGTCVDEEGTLGVDDLREDVEGRTRRTVATDSRSRANPRPSLIDPSPLRGRPLALPWSTPRPCLVDPSPLPGDPSPFVGRPLALPWSTLRPSVADLSPLRGRPRAPSSADRLHRPGLDHPPLCLRPLAR